MNEKTLWYADFAEGAISLAELTVTMDTDTFTVQQRRELIGRSPSFVSPHAAYARNEHFHDTLQQAVAWLNSHAHAWIASTLGRIAKTEKQLDYLLTLIEQLEENNGLPDQT